MAPLRRHAAVAAVVAGTVACYPFWLDRGDEPDAPNPDELCLAIRRNTSCATIGGDCREVRCINDPSVMSTPCNRDRETYLGDDSVPAAIATAEEVESLMFDEWSELDSWLCNYIDQCWDEDVILAACAFQPIE